MKINDLRIVHGYREVGTDWRCFDFRGTVKLVLEDCQRVITGTTTRNLNLLT